MSSSSRPSSAKVPAPGKIAILLLVVLASMGTAGVIRALTYMAPIDYYTRGANDLTLVASARLGSGDSVIWHGPREEGGTVTVFVWVRRTPPVDGARARDLMANHVVIPVRLHAVLRQRAVAGADARRAAEERP